MELVTIAILICSSLIALRSRFILTSVPAICCCPSFDLEGLDLEGLDLERLDLERLDLERLDLERLDLERLDLESLNRMALIGSRLEHRNR